MDRLAIRGRLLSKNDVLANPEVYKDKRVMIFEIENNDHYEAAKTFHKEWKGKMHRLMLNLHFQSDSFSERARHLFFAMRDHICRTQEDTSRANKDAVYHAVMERCDFRFPDGRPKLHIDEMDKKELWEAIQMIQRVLDEVEYNYEYGPQINDLQRDYESGK